MIHKRMDGLGAQQQYGKLNYVFYKISCPGNYLQCLKNQEAVVLMVFYKFSDTVRTCFIRSLEDVCSCFCGS